MAHLPWIGSLSAACARGSRPAHGTYGARRARGPGASSRRRGARAGEALAHVAGQIHVAGGPRVRVGRREAAPIAPPRS